MGGLSLSVSSLSAANDIPFPYNDRTPGWVWPTMTLLASMCSFPSRVISTMPCRSEWKTLSGA